MGMDLRYFGAAAKSLTVEGATHSDVKPGTGKNSLCSEYCRFPCWQCPFPGNAFTYRCRYRRYIIKVAVQRFSNSSCPVRTRHVSFVLNNLGHCHLHRMLSFAG